MIDLAEARARDAADPLAAVRDRFALPPGVIYLDGNSLGPLPRCAAAALAEMTERQWGERLVRGWNEGWFDAPTRIGDKIARLIGAHAGEVVACDTTSANLFKLIVAALAAAPPERRVVLSEAGNFPTDLHIAHGAVACVPGASLRVVPRAALEQGLRDDVGLVLLTHVHYRTAERFDLAAWTARAHAAGAMILWDLSHSVGAVQVALDAAGADLAVGCGYKFLNGGPGAPAWLYVAARHQERLVSPVSGWMGHGAPFAFDDAYRPAPGIRRWLAGTPPILGLAALEAGVEEMLAVDLAAREAKGRALFDQLAAIGETLGLECPTPRAPEQRGSHIAFRHPQANALSQALIEAGVIGDFRTPDILRLAITPLYTGFEDVGRAGCILAELLASGAYRDPRFSAARTVT